MDNEVVQMRMDNTERVVTFVRLHAADTSNLHQALHHQRTGASTTVANTNNANLALRIL